MTTMTWEQQKEALTREFRRMDIDKDDRLTQEDLCYYLDQKNDGVEFDRNVALQLFEKMNKDEDGKVTVNEFIRVWSVAQKNLEEKIKYCNAEVQRSDNEIANIDKKKSGLKETTNSQGIATDAKLYVTLISGANINAEQAIVRLTCGNQSYETAKTYSNHPNFNIDYIFEVNHAQMPFIIQLYDVRNPAMHQLEFTIQLRDLADQLKHTEWIDLYAHGTRKTDSRLKMNMQYIWSKNQYLQRMRDTWVSYKTKMADEAVVYKDDQDALNEPFEFVKKLAYGNYYIERVQPTNYPGAPVRHYQENEFVQITSSPQSNLRNWATIFGA